jgi:hypothetical protein
MSAPRPALSAITASTARFMLGVVGTTSIGGSKSIAKHNPWTYAESYIARFLRHLRGVIKVRL